MAIGSDTYTRDAISHPQARARAVMLCDSGAAKCRLTEIAFPAHGMTWLNGCGLSAGRADMTQQFATQQDLERKSRMTEQRIDQLERCLRALEQRVESNAVAARKAESDLAEKTHENRINLILVAFAAVGVFWMLLIALIVKDRG